MTNIAFIPVRGGSKSIPLKNIKPLMGKPLLYWTTKAASDCPLIDRVILATEHPEIKKTILSLNLPKVEVYDRDIENAQDTSTTESVVLEYLDKNPYSPDDFFFLLQATSPLTKAEHIQGIYNKMRAEGKTSALTCVRTHRFYWNENGTPINYDYLNRPRRQQFKGTLMENGAIYVNQISNFGHEKNRLFSPMSLYEMPSYTAFEIDEPDDWLILETLMKKYKLNDPLSD